MVIRARLELEYVARIRGGLGLVSGLEFRLPSDGDLAELLSDLVEVGDVEVWLPPMQIWNTRHNIEPILFFG